MGEKREEKVSIDKKIVEKRGEGKTEQKAEEKAIQKTQKDSSHNIIAPKTKKKKELTFLYLAEMGFGTNAYDPLAMNGLAFFLKKNRYRKKLNAVIMQGSLMPYVPDFYTKTASQDQVFLGKDPERVEKRKRKEPIDESGLVTLEDLAEDKEYLDEGDIKYYKTYLEDGIRDNEGAINATKKEMLKLKKVIGDTPVHYQHGEEDRKKVDALIETLIGQYEEKTKTRLKADYEQLKLEREELKERINLLEEKKEKIEKKEGKPGKKLGQTKKRMEKIGEEIKSQDIKLREVEHDLVATRKRAATGFRKFVRADQYNLFFRRAKRMHNSDLYKAAPGMDFHVHSTSEKRIGARWLGTIKDKEVKEEPSLLKISGLEVLLAHNLNFRSDNVGVTTLSEMKIDNNFMNKMRKLYGKSIGNVPDIFLTSHNAGGFIAQPQPKYTENTIEGERRETPEICMNIKLPTFQSVPRLIQLKSKRIKNWHTKRLDEKIYASGAVIHNIKKDGVHVLEYVDVAGLIELGKLSKKIEEKTALIKQYSLEGKGKRGKDIEKLRSEIEELGQSAKLDTMKIEASGDDEIGVANYPGRPSNYDFIEASQKYQLKNGLPDIFIHSEGIHGTIPGIFDINSQYFAPVPKKLEEKIQEIMKSELAPRKKMKLIDKTYREAIYAIPITVTDLRLEEWKHRILPYVTEILDNGGKVIFVSGNHYSNPREGRDEATVLASEIPEEYGENVLLARGLGEKYGSGTFRLEGNKVLYTAHKLKEGSDEITGAMKQILKSSKDADIVVYFDRHHPGIGFADGSAYTLAPGKQPWNKYVDVIGKFPSLRGIVNMSFDKKKPYYKWEFVLDSTLEKYMKK